MLERYKVEWILIGCQLIYLSSVGKKKVLKVVPKISFLCAIIVLVVVRIIFKTISLLLLS